MQSANQLQYVEFLKLREKYKQQVLKLNNIRSEKISMIIKINDLEERLLETVTTRKSLKREAHSHSLHSEVPTNKTGPGYVPTSISDTPSTSKTIFLRPVILESPPPRMDKGYGRRSSFQPSASGQASYQEKASHMPSLWQARAHQTKLPTLPSSAKEKMAGS